MNEDRELLRLRATGRHPRLLADAFGRTETAIKARLALLSKYPPAAELSLETGKVSTPERDSWIGDRGLAGTSGQPLTTTRRERLRAIGLERRQHGLSLRAMLEIAPLADLEAACSDRTPIEAAREWLRERQAHLQLANQFTRNMLARTEERIRESRAILGHPLPPNIKRTAQRVEPDGRQ